MSDTANVLVRGIPRSTLAKIDARVDAINHTRAGKNKLTRNAFIVSILDERIESWFDDYKKSEYDYKTDIMIDMLQEYLNATDRVYDLLASGQVSEGIDLYDELAKSKNEN